MPPVWYRPMPQPRLIPQATSLSKLDAVEGRSPLAAWSRGLANRSSEEARQDHNGVGIDANQNDRRQQRNCKTAPSPSPRLIACRATNAVNDEQSDGEQRRYHCCLNEQETTPIAPPLQARSKCRTEQGAGSQRLSACALRAAKKAKGRVPCTCAQQCRCAAGSRQR